MAQLEQYLSSEEFLFEGEQAEEYKKRKAAEKAELSNKNNGRGYSVGYKSAANKIEKNLALNKKEGYDRHMKKADEDFKRSDKAKKIVDKESNRRAKSGGLLHQLYFDVNRDKAYDAANRHIRRHPKQYKESAELYGDSIELI